MVFRILEVLLKKTLRSIQKIETKTVPSLVFNERVISQISKDQPYGNQDLNVEIHLHVLVQLDRA